MSLNTIFFVRHWKDSAQPRIQAIDDLRDCPSNLNAEFVIGAVVEKAKFKLVYQLQNPETAEWMVRMTGSILVEDEMRKVKTDIALTEKMETDRMIHQAERYYIDCNMLLNLPPFVCFFHTNRPSQSNKIFPYRR